MRSKFSNINPPRPCAVIGLIWHSMISGQLGCSRINVLNAFKAFFTSEDASLKASNNSKLLSNMYIISSKSWLSLGSEPLLLNAYHLVAKNTDTGTTGISASPMLVSQAGFKLGFQYELVGPKGGASNGLKSRRIPLQA